MESEKKKINMVSSIATLEIQKKPGIVPSRMLAVNAVFGPYVRLANSNTIHMLRSENATATSLPEAALAPNIRKLPVVKRSYKGG